MLKMIRKCSSIFLVIVLVFGLVPTWGFANNEVWDGTIPAQNENAGYSGGEGSELKPYLISNAGDLAQLMVNTNAGGTSYSANKYFLQTADIVLNYPDVFAVDEEGVITGLAEGKTANLWFPIGISYIFNFSGHYDGGGRAVRGIYIDIDKYLDEPGYVGLFGRASGATITNVGVESSYIKGDVNVGGVVGNCYRGSVINSYNTGTVVGKRNDIGGVAGWLWGEGNNLRNSGRVTGVNNVGGLIGRYGGEGDYGLRDSYNTGEVRGIKRVGGLVGEGAQAHLDKCYNLGKVTGEDAVGGLIGCLFGGSGENAVGSTRRSFNLGDVTGIENVGGIIGENSTLTSVTTAYNTGHVTGQSVVGGVVGNNSKSNSLITNTYNVGNVIGNDSFGGVVGESLKSENVKTSYYLDTVVQNPTNTLGTALTEAEMRLAGSFVNFNFGWDWEIGVTENYNYPTLILLPHPTVFDDMVCISFDSDGGSAVAPIFGKTGDPIPDISAPTKEGHIFLKWQPALPAIFPEENLFVKALWEAQIYDITFVLDNGEDDVIVPTEHGKVPQAPTGFEKYAHTFVGWDAELVAATAAATYTAQWVLNVYDITFDFNNGDESLIVPTNHGAYPSVPPNPAKRDHVFMGWYPEIVPANCEATYTATWLGDINIDGRVNTLDALMALKHVTGESPLTGFQLVLADVNRDERVNVLDALMILQFASGKRTSFSK
ncbi:MAG: hypothetical protein GX345_05455 [Clostridiales bacterium]|nr:hypothetical protein [Clostridiales bacterium]